MRNKEKVYKALQKKRTKGLYAKKEDVFKVIELIEKKEATIKALEEALDYIDEEIKHTYMYAIDGGSYCELLSIIEDNK